MFQQGDFRQTGNPLDMVIEGEGFFQVQLPDGHTGYTRDGTFKVDSQGRLVTSDGYALQPEITVPAEAGGKITLCQEGRVYGNLPGSSAPRKARQTQLAPLLNPACLVGVGRHALKPTPAP